jgi:hypothetical protein
MCAVSIKGIFDSPETEIFYRHSMSQVEWFDQFATAYGGVPRSNSYNQKPISRFSFIKSLVQLDRRTDSTINQDLSHYVTPKSNKPTL